MKKLWWLLAIFIVATAAKEGLNYFGPMAGAYRAYREEAATTARSREKEPRFRDIEGNITDVTYSLVSAELLREGQVRLVVVESLQFQKFSETGPFGNRRIAATRQSVLMSRLDGRWVVSELSEDATEVRSLDEIELPR